jgi:hypothetical protein
MNAQTISLKPDQNRKTLQSLLATKLSDGFVEDSICRLETDCWAQGRKPRVLLMVPYYTRIKRPLDVILENVIKHASSELYLKRDKDTIAALRGAGVSESYPTREDWTDRHPSSMMVGL